MSCWVYILKSEKDGKLYIGQSNDIEARLWKHNKGGVHSTRNRRPFKLFFSKVYSTKAEAMRMERYLKSLKGGNEFKKYMKQWGIAKW